MRVRRFDSGSTDRARAQKTPEGFLRAPARLTRVGVFPYRTDKVIRRELRLPEEVFRPDSLATFELMPLTNDHPKNPLDVTNAGAHQVGSVGGIHRDKEDPDYMAGTVLITERRAVQDVESGKVEISNGYACDLEIKSGIWVDSQGRGHPYDAIQRNIRANHIAIVERGRAGPGARLRLDAADESEIGEQIRQDTQLLTYKVGDRVRRTGIYVGPKAYAGVIVEVRETLPGYFGTVYSILFDGSSVPSDSEKGGLWWFTGAEIELDDSHKQDGAPVDQKGKTMKLRMDGNEFEVDEKLAAAIAKERGDSAEMVKTAQAAVTEQRARADAAENKVTTLTKELGEARDPKKFEKAVADRVQLHADAREILGADTKFDGLDETEVRKRAILKLDGSAKLDGETPEYVKARFDSDLRHFRAKNPASEQARQKIDEQKRADAAGSGGEKKTDKVDPRAEFEKNMYGARDFATKL
jgi:uncharacterized protein